MRKAGLRIWAASSAFALVGIFGVFGFVTDFADIPGNDLSTGTWEGGGPTIDIQLAPTVNGACTDPNLVWSDNTIPAVFDSGSIDVASGSHDYWADYFCARAAPGASGLFVYSMVTDFIEVDNACSAGEAEAGDTDCGTGTSGSGEISDFVYVTMYQAFSDCGNFTPAGSTPALSDGAITGGFSVDSTPSCMAFRLSTGSFSDSLVLDTVQTDSATWTWRVVGSE